MWLNDIGLPMQQNGDQNDTCARTGMCDVGITLAIDLGVPPTNETDTLHMHCIQGLATHLQPSPGVYVRYEGCSIYSTSADQLIPVIAAHTLANDTGEVTSMYDRMKERYGFAQNTVDTLDGSGKTKMADFMYFRAMPLFARAFNSRFTLFFDLYLVIMAISNVLVTNKDDVDFNNLVVTFAVCEKVKSTILSRLAVAVVAKYQPANFGSRPGINNVQAGLEWYHRASSGGNPEIADIYRPITKELFG